MKTKEIAKAVKAAAKKMGLKVSARSEYNSVSISIQEAPFQVYTAAVLLGEAVLNEALTIYVNETFTPKALEAQRALEAVASAEQRTITEDQDYGSVPNYYVHVSFAYDLRSRELAALEPTLVADLKVEAACDRKACRARIVQIREAA